MDFDSLPASSAPVPADHILRRLQKPRLRHIPPTRLCLQKHLFRRFQTESHGFLLSSPAQNRNYHPLPADFRLLRRRLHLALLCPLHRRLPLAALYLRLHHLSLVLLYLRHLLPRRLRPRLALLYPLHLCPSLAGSLPPLLPANRLPCLPPRAYLDFMQAAPPGREPLAQAA